ncbi:aminoglycoside 6-adenylyltransferase [Fictibacillus terranigra]|uniref:Aminoglycoside 6-adenylyltransferase n=1 Tax=Fictibacillus terranigra TaxID=3058424 RepID=A0ABT8E7Z9_9BACL|nr:aminoglycoside 6-adenylyltransferase [Fictibacillus sp. CENA-BCM004]MDN4074025.1 aminoglycoside 6-adenylyltransferase [Fictibacillus sp. CENA-BCM004]
MLAKIIKFANKEKRIRAVILNGSRVNPNAPKDIFQDYDVVFITEDVAYYIENRNWIRPFGEIMIMQTPDAMAMGTAELGEISGKYTYLMQFMDGMRIDLTFYPAGKVQDLVHDSLSKVILDKDGILPELPEPSDQDYITKCPSEREFLDCCNEFWWVSTYIAKGLWRKELPYAKAMFDGPVRNMLILMLKWQIGLRHDFSVDSGKHGKYFKSYLEPEMYGQLLQTYSDGQYENIWEALFEMGRLFRRTSQDLAGRLGFRYAEDEDHHVTAYLRHVRHLPFDAEKMY